MAASCGAEAPPRDLVLLSGSTMGTSWKVSVVSPAAPAADLQREIQATLSRIDGAMSTYQADSELSRFNRSGSTDPQPLTAETLGVVAESLALAEASGGALDPTVLPLVDLWGFGPAGRRAGVPSAAEVEQTRARTGWRRLELDLPGGTLTKRDAGIQLDLSAVAKGFGVDAVCDRLDDFGCLDYFVEVGGEVRAKGLNAKGVAWRVGIDKPVALSPPGQQVQQVVQLDGLAMATSGDYRNFREFDGRRYSHTIDPRTGFPVDHGLASVSVVAPTCMEADALATAIGVLGPEAGWDFASARAGVEVLLVARGADGKVTERMTPGFRELLASR